MSTSTCQELLSKERTGTPPAAFPAKTAGENSYGQILKSSALIGGSSVLNIAIGVVRTKAMALLLGPAGLGLTGLYTSIADITQNLAGLGINSSGVRQIAEAAGSADTLRIARTSATLRGMSVFLGLLGALVLIIFSPQISSLTFGSRAHSGAVRLLALAVLFRLVAAGEAALVQGMRRIGDLAIMGVSGALAGTFAGILLVYFFRENGIVPSLIAVAVMTFAASWWCRRKIPVPQTSLTPLQMRQEVAPLLKLGFAFMGSSVLTLGAAYLVRVLLLRQVGFEATGCYQAAWTLGGLYVGFILQAMGADFYPRLTASVHDHAACNRIVNEQARVGLLLAAPGVIATLAFAPLVIGLFYSSRFHDAVRILRWICLGTTLQVVTWPMGFIVLAKARQNIFLLSDVAWAMVYVALASICIQRFGVDGAGIAFFGSYIFHLLLTYPVVRRLSGFRWSSENEKTGLLSLSSIGLVFCGFYVLPFAWAVFVGTLAAILSFAYSVRALAKLIPIDRIPRAMVRLLATLRLLPSESVSGI